MYVSVLVMLLPVHRHLKFSHVLGQTSVNNSNTILPAKGRQGERERGENSRLTNCGTHSVMQVTACHARIPPHLLGTPLMVMSKKHLGRGMSIGRPAGLG